MYSLGKITWVRYDFLSQDEVFLPGVQGNIDIRVMMVQTESLCCSYPLSRIVDESSGKLFCTIDSWACMYNLCDKYQCLMNIFVAVRNKSAAGMQHTPPRDIFNGKIIILKQGL